MRKDDLVHSMRLLNDEDLLKVRGGYEKGDIIHCADTFITGCAVEMVYCQTMETACGSGFTFKSECLESTCSAAFSTTCTKGHNK